MSHIKPKVAIIIKKYPFGGAERQAKELCVGLKNNQYDVNLISIEGKSSYKDDNIYIIGLNKRLTGLGYSPLKVINNFNLYYNLYKLIYNNYDCVITFVQLYPLGFLFSNLKTIISIRMFYPNSINNTKRYLLKRFNLVISNNLPQYSLLHAMGVKSILVNNVVAQRDNNSITRKPSEVVRFLVVSNYSKRKNIITILKAFKRLDLDKFSLTIIGEFPEYYNLHEFKIRSNIFFTGHLAQQEIEKYYMSSDCLIHASFREGSANAILDAMRFKLPVIASNIPENISLIGNNQNNLFDPNSFEDLSRKLEVFSYLKNENELLNNYLEYQYLKIKYDYDLMNNEYLIEEIRNCIKPIN
jgi:glycosyltransferase involved in cell wall biosynthesis